MAQVTVATYTSKAEANMAAQVLADGGLDASVAGDDAGGTIPHLPLGTGAPSVSVPVEQEQEAARLLDIGTSDSRREVGQATAERSEIARSRRAMRVGAALALLVIAFGIVATVVI